MKANYLVLSVLAASLFVNACKKDEENATPAPTPGTPAAINPIRSYLAANLNAARQSFTVNATTGGGITGNKGSHVDFMPGAFLTASGSPVSGMVQVKLIEVLDIADMILLNKQTVGIYGGQLRLLRSGGEVKIEATQGGNEVFIIPNGAVVSIPGGGSIDPEMDVFYGTEDSDGDVVWNLSTDTIAIQDSVAWDTTGTSTSWFYYALYPNSLNWINCDYFPSGSLATVLADAPDGFDGTNTMVWLALPSMNGLGGAWYNGSLLFETYASPIGYQGVIVGLHVDADGNYFSSFTNVTVAPGLTVPITFTPTTLPEFVSAVDAL
ncbi:MAG: hypothetical protein IPL52_02960 [Flavobacteriales bacterium]|nr:hypothetical protein [Flavobacteriales bacterium]